MSGFQYSGDKPLIADGSADDPQLPEARIRDGWHANSIYRRLEYDDTDSELARANIDAQIDGALPYSRSVMADAGRGEDANVNFREAKAEDDLAQTPFIEMGTVSPILWRIKTNFGKPGDQTKWSAILSSEFSKTVRDWGEDFDYYRQRLAQQFTRHGAGFAYFEDEFNWQWRADGLSAFKLERDTESRSSAIDYCTCKRSMTVTELYKFVRNETLAKEVGRWNVEAVKRAILTAAASEGQTFYNYQWQDFERQMKENDIDMGSKSKKVQVYHLWVREYDGQIAHYIGLQNGVAMVTGDIIKCEGASNSLKGDMIGNGFLYAHRFRFPEFKSCIVPFFYAIGTHATVHTIRGQGEMNFAPISISNRTRCTLIDAAKASSMILMRAETPSDVENFAYIQVGGFMVYSGGNSKVEPTAMPDVSARVQPILSEMANLRQNLLPMSVAQSPAGPKSKQPETKYAIQAKQNRGGALSSAMLTQWFGPFGRLGEEMYRRMVNPKLTEQDPGGKEAFAFRVRCMKRGVPAEAMDFDVCEVDAVRVIGNGSPEARQYAAEQVWELADAFDEPGRKLALRDVVGSIPGVDFQAADDYVGPIEPRQPVDEQIANNENSLFTLGATAKVTGEQDHWVHCQVHMEMVKEFVQEFQNGAIVGGKLVSVLKPALDNMLAHSEYLTKDKTREKESAEVRKFIQNNNGVLEQQENKLIAAMQRQQQQPQGQNGQQPDGEEIRAQQMHQAKLRQMQQEAEMRQREMQQKLAIQQQEAHARMTIADLKAAHDMAEQAAALASQPA